MPSEDAVLFHASIALDSVTKLTRYQRSSTGILNRWLIGVQVCLNASKLFELCRAASLFSVGNFRRQAALRLDLDQAPGTPNEVGCMKLPSERSSKAFRYIAGLDLWAPSTTSALRIPYSPVSDWHD